MKKLFAAASGIFGSIPGISIMLSGLGTPPGYSKIFGGVIQAFGALSILLLLTSKDKLKRLARPRVTIAAIALAVGSLCSLILYLQLSSLCIVTHPVHGTVYYPLWNSGHALEIVERAGGRYAAVDRYGSYPVSKAIQEAPNYPLSIVITTAVLLLLYQGVFTMLTLAFGIIGVRDDANLKELASAIGKPRKSSPPPTPAKSRAASSHS